MHFLFVYVYIYLFIYLQVPSQARCLGKVRLGLPEQALVADSPWVAGAKDGFLDHLVPEETASLVLGVPEDHHHISRVSLIEFILVVGGESVCDG